MRTGAKLLGATTLLLAACGGGGGAPAEAPGELPPPPAPTVADVTLLIMGNSHSYYNNIQRMIAEMLRAARPGQTVEIVPAPGSMYLEERWNDPRTMQLLRNQDWSVVILQAQKYSTSGTVDYSTEEAKDLIRVAREQNALPVMFPEWPRLGVHETHTIYNLHVSIAEEEPACVAPVGQAFDLSASRNPALTLHAGDGNHSNPNGAFLAALVLFATISGESPLDVPVLDGFNVESDIQALLRATADETVRSFPPGTWCPDDVPVSG